MSDPSPQQSSDESSSQPAADSDSSAENAAGPAASAEVDPPGASSVAEGAVSSPAARPAGSGGPISLEKIRQLRQSQRQSATARPKPTKTPPAADQPETGGDQPSKESSKKPGKPARQKGSGKGNVPLPTPDPVGVAPKVAVPSQRQPLSQDMEEELAAALGDSDLDKILVGDSMLQVGRLLEEGQRVQAKVVKAQGEFVFLSLGGPNEGVIPAVQFEETPEPGTQLEVVVRGFLAEEGLYELTIPGNAVDVSDWSDLQEGEVVEALVTGSNTGGLECKVGAIDGFIPASQVAEYRVENLADMIDQKVLCVVTEANPRRGNLVLSRRAVLEREKKEKREERLATLEVGAAVDGTVRKILDFGAFVDIGGLDGLLHISQLSWERVKHPSEILEEGQKIQVRVDKIDEQTGKIGLSYRSLQDHPWDDIEARFPVGSVVRGTVTRIAEFGAFVRIATGVEGLVHLSELAHHRVHRVGNVVQEGQEIEVKILSIDAEQQRIGLSLKAVQAAPEPSAETKEETKEEEVEEPRPEPVLPKHRGPLKGGTGKPSGGEQFGLKW